MKLKIHKFGCLEETEVDLHGITIISGENDTGKSSIGKLLFSIIKADNIAQHKLEDYCKNNIKKTIAQLKSDLLKTKPNLVKLVKEPRNLMDLTKLKNLLKINLTKQFEIHSTEKKLKKLEIFLNKEKAFLYRRNIEFLKQITYNFGSYKNFLHKGCLKLSALDETPLYEICITGDYKVDFKDFFHKKLKGIKPFKDVTFISTPVALDLVEFFYRIVLEKKGDLKYPYPFIIRDLVRKLLREKKSIFEYGEIIEYIEKLIKGSIKLDNDRVLFEKEGKVFEMLGTATGIKSFGILKLLLENGTLSSNNFLIIDEPEVHLHPKWQIKYVELLLILHKHLDLKMLITTHSPYIIQAFRYYLSREYKDYANKVKVYLSNGKKLEDITNNIGLAFKLLGEPLWQIA